EVVLQPLPSRLTDLEARLDAVVETGDGLHALLRREAALGPEVLLLHAHHGHEVHALVVEGVVLRPEERLPVLAEIEEPVVLADHHPDRRLHGLQDLPAEVELLLAAELCQVAAHEDEVGLRLKSVHVVDRLQDRAYEAIVQRAGIEVRVRDVGEGEALRGVHHLDELEAVRRDEPLAEGDSRREAGELQERAARDAPEPGKEGVALRIVLRLDAPEAPSHTTSPFARARRMRPASPGPAWARGHRGRPSCRWPPPCRARGARSSSPAGGPSPACRTRRASRS